MAPKTKPYFVQHPDRALIRVGGAEGHSFLQNLITNDMDLLDTQASLYACLLTPQGKFLFDFFISHEGQNYLLDCEGGARAELLLKKLTFYRLRSPVDLSLENDKPLYIIMNTDQVTDPRHPQLGHRTFTKPEGMEEKPFSLWDHLRISLCVPDGSRDMEVEKATLIESGLDRLNGISFTKGCYVGQEITARMHHRGLAKKHFRALPYEETPPASGSDILTPDGHLAGQAFSSSEGLTLALIKDEYAGLFT